MMAKVRYEDFTARSEDAFYPFVKTSPLNRSHDFSLPSGLILDAALHIPDSVGYYTLTSITSAGDRLLFDVRSNDGGIARGEWVGSQPNLNCVDLFTQVGDSSGVLLVSQNEAVKLLSELPEGTYRFDELTAVFAPATYHFVPGTNRSLDTTGLGLVSPDEDLIIRGHNGVYLECRDGNEIVIHAVGDPRGRRAVCEDTFSPDMFIREVVFQRGEQTIRCQPTDGNVEIRVVSDSEESALRLQQRNGELVFNLVGAKQ